MADEITISASISVLKAVMSPQAIARAVSDLILSMGGNVYSEGTILIDSSTPTAFPLGQIGTGLGWCFFHNLDTTNFVKIRNGSGGSDFIKLTTSGVTLTQLMPSVAPYGLADTAACLVEYLMFAV